MTAWTPETLLVVNRSYDYDRASDGYSRYGAYIRDRKDSFVDPWSGGGPLDPAPFVAKAWRIAADGRIMTPGLVWLRDDILSVQVEAGDNDKLTATVTVPVTHDLLKRRLPYHWQDWGQGFHSTDDRYPQPDRPEPAPSTGPTVILTAQIAHAGPWEPIPKPTHTSGRGLVDECLAAVEHMAEQINTAMGPVVRRLLGGQS